VISAGGDRFLSHWGEVLIFWEVFGEDMGKALVNPSTCIREFVFGGYQKYLSHCLCDFDVREEIV